MLRGAPLPSGLRSSAHSSIGAALPWVAVVDSNHTPNQAALRVCDKIKSSPSSSVPTCVMRERHVQCGVRGVRTRWVANL